MKKVVRPFDRKALILGKDAMHRVKGGDAHREPEFCNPVPGRGIDQKQTCMKIARRRRPYPAMPPPPLGLRGGDNPEPSRIAGPGARQGFVVGRRELVVMNQTIPVLLCGSSETKQGKTTILFKFKTRIAPPRWWRQ